MVKCSICKINGHSAPRCNSALIREWTENIKRFWLYGHNNSAENDIAVKEWARTARINMPLVNRIWSKLRVIFRENRWSDIGTRDVDRFAQIKFFIRCPNNYPAVRLHIENYVRPTEQEPIAEALVEQEVIQLEAELILLIDRDERRAQRRRAEQERADGLIAERLVRRQIEAVEDPYAQVRRNLQRDFDRANAVVQNAQAQAIQALKVKKSTPSIQSHMDTLDQVYFMNTDCPICMEPQTPGNTIALNCRHTVCVECLKRTLKPAIKNCCPCCRDPITQIRFKPDITPANFNTISSHIHSLS